MAARVRLRVEPGADAQIVLDAQVRRAVRQLRRRPLPPLYSSGVRYVRERNKEDWRLPQEVYRRGGGDCEDLAVWLAAEKILSGEKARAVQKPGGRRGLVHVVVRTRSGVEDPSKVLGM